MILCSRPAGMGVSGGEEGARLGPSLMPGGPKEAYESVKPMCVSSFSAPMATSAAACRGAS